MRQFIRFTGILFAALLFVAGCGTGMQPTVSITQTPEVTGSVIPTPADAEGSSASAKQEAPPYEQILAGLYKITKTPAHPDGPDVKDDGIVDKDLEQAVKDYSLSLRGMKVTNWSGWFLFSSPISRMESISDTIGVPYYRIRLLKREPPVEGTRYLSEYIYLLLRDPTSDRQEYVNALQYGQSIVFSGEFGGIDAWGVVVIENGHILESVQ